MKQTAGDILSQVLQPGFDDGIVGADFPGHPLRLFCRPVRRSETFPTQNILVGASHHSILINRLLLRFPAEADVVVEIISVEPGLDVFASLAVPANVLGKKGERFGIAIRSSSFHKGGPSLDFPWGARRLGIGMNPFEDFTVALSGVQLLCKSFEVEPEKPDEVLVAGRVEIVFAVFSGELCAAFVENARQQDKAAQADAHAAGRTLS
jgi:hypothetical protein